MILFKHPIGIVKENRNKIITFMCLNMRTCVRTREETNYFLTITYY